ncbi:MAG: glycosyltransferase family 4 protein [Anaerolineales bacterium]|nr:glycosyltransferase family 4 protein [Anaerolineales bacterium]
MDKLVYIARSRIPSNRANCVQTLKMCSGFAAHLPVELIAPYYPEDARRKETLAERFALPRPFDVTWVRFPHWGNRFAVRGYALAAAWHARRRRAGLAYSREPWSAYHLARAGVGVGFEAHHLEEDRRYPVWKKLVADPALSPALRGIFCISKSLIEDYAAAGARRNLLHWAPDGVDLQRFEPSIGRAEARQKLGLPAAAKIICHAGHLYPGRGAEEAVEAVGAIPESVLLMAGGNPGDIERVRAFSDGRGMAERVRFAGTVPNGKIPLYLWAADVLIMPYTSRTETVGAMSPLKMFEYMAAGRPIVATDFPAVREVLRDGENALLVSPDSAESLARGIRRSLEDPALAESISRRAREDVRAFTWELRAERILEILEKP